MRGDPKGYYERLEVSPRANRDAIHAAYRRQARLLHPDVPGTGNARAFVAMKEAYEVLADPLRRAAYDRQAREEQTNRSAPVDDAEEIFAPPPPPMPSVHMRHPRISDLPLVLWLALSAVLVVAAFEALVNLTAPSSVEHTAAIPATAPSVMPLAPPPPPTPVRLAGTPNAYVLPASGAAVVWRHDDARNAFLPVGQLPPFSAVQVIRVLRQNGLVEIRLDQNGFGFVEGARLSPGSAEAAHQAYCAYNAGPLPTNGEVLARGGSGSARLSVVNHSGQPAVVKLRTSEGESAATVYLAPNGVAQLEGLPTGAYRPEYAIGEMWSRACNSFAAGMRAQRFVGFTDLSHLSPLNVPPDVASGPLPEDIPDQAFERP